MQIDSFTVGPFAENTYLLSQGKNAILVDPGFSEKNELEAFLKHLDAHPASLRAIVLTHAHIDHVLGLKAVLQEIEVPVYLNDTDRYLWENVEQQARMFGFSFPSFDFEPRPLPVQNNWSIAGFSFDVRYTPGHAPDHVSLYNAENELLIAGDTLFKEGIGRTDLYKGDYKLLEKSIKTQLYTLPEITVVYPGHGPSTTIGHEKKHNPFVQE